MIITITCEGSKLTASADEPIVAGSAKEWKFDLSTDSSWDGLALIVCFLNRRNAKAVLYDGGTQSIPEEMTEKPGELYISVTGVDGNGRRKSTACLAHALPIIANGTEGAIYEKPVPSRTLIEQAVAKAMEAVLTARDAETAAQYAKETAEAAKQIADGFADSLAALGIKTEGMEGRLDELELSNEVAFRLIGKYGENISELQVKAEGLETKVQGAANIANSANQLAARAYSNTQTLTRTTETMQDQINAMDQSVQALDATAEDHGRRIAALEEGGGGGGGTTDHRALTNRDAADQHPMSAITGLADALGGFQAKLTTTQISKINNAVNSVFVNQQIAEAIGPLDVVADDILAAQAAILEVL